jgi:hypothetical protein
VSVGRASRTGFARTQKGLEYALVQDATGKTAGEIHDMARSDRYMTALLRARWYRERNSQAKKAQRKGGR